MKKAPLSLFAIFCLAILLVSSASAFPLSGGNGQIGITIFGTIRDADSCSVDLGAPDGFQGKISLVDSEDKFYSSSKSPDIGWGKNRFFLPFKISKEADIKRIKFEPYNQLPFSIDWEAIPEVSDSSMTLKFYNLAGSPYYMPNQMEWVFDIKLTNNAGELLKLNTKPSCLIRHP